MSLLTPIACTTPQSTDSGPDGRGDVVSTIDGSDSPITDTNPTDSTDSTDAPTPDIVSNACVTDADCDDHQYCNGAERCMPGATGADSRGCVAASPATPCSPSEVCNETTDRCTDASCANPDADGDGHRATACGGDDCDDADANRFPGRSEVCDAMNHDEDCDAATFGVRDGDGDGDPDARCCNVLPTGAMNCGNDCDDTRATVNVSAPEVCNGRDDNCDAVIDDGVLRTFHPDTDGDGAGDPAGATMMACNPPAGFVENATDCDDHDSRRSPSGTETCDGIDNDCDMMIDEGVQRTFTVDGDGDGFGATAGATMMACNPPAGFVENNGDCNDGSASVHPGAPEVCDGATPPIDEDCDGTANPASLCVCVAGAARPCALPGACASGTEMCSGTSWGACSISPSTETCDGIDNDCDGSTDEGLTLRCYVDGDNDGYAPIGAGVVDSCPVVGREAVGGCPVSQTNRAPIGTSIDCDDNDALRSPRAAEDCNAIDDNCNGMVDEGLRVACYADLDNDTYSPAGSMLVMSCSVTGRGMYGGCPLNETSRAPVDAASTDCADADPGRNPVGTEVCNGLDDDCDGMIDEGVSTTYYRDSDGDNYGVSTATRAACSPPAGYVANSTDCDDTRVSVHPGAPEICDTVDNDCDGMVDEGAMPIAHYPDADNDGYGNPAGTPMTTCTAPPGYAPNNADCDDTRVDVHPGLTEVCNGRDDNCNGMTDEGVIVTFYRDGDADGFGSAAMSMTACSMPAGYVPNSQDCDDANASVRPGAPEPCNRRDDDCSSGGGADLAEDADNDMHAPIGATCSGGFPRDDCDDTIATTFTGAPEICDGHDSNCNGTVDEEPAATALCPASANLCNNGRCDAQISISRGGVHTCVARASGIVQCWGNNSSGELGDGTVTQRLTPVRVLNLTDAVQVAAGDGHTCARRAGGVVSCWGAGTSGQLGNGTIVSTRMPVTVSGLSGATSIDAGGAHTCVTRSAGTVMCWGRNSNGQLGDGTNTTRNTPVSASGTTGATVVSAGGSHTCAITATGTVLCWGENTWGQLGDGDMVDSAYPATATGVTGARSLGTTDNNTCATLASGQLWCWGLYLGDVTPTRVAGITDAAQPVVWYPASADPTVCYRRTGGGIRCWGDGAYGSLGQGSTTDSTTYVDVIGIADAVEITEGGCARRTTGALVCWGRNFDGQIGDGTRTDRTSPVPVLFP